MLTIKIKLEAEPRLLSALEKIAAHLVNTGETQKKIDQLAAQLTASNQRLKTTLQENS